MMGFYWGIYFIYYFCIICLKYECGIFSGICVCGSSEC